ncbi:MAG: YraN family protein [Acidimicrobiia bacterium]|nr:YraN family protein [Acidimicrobiia bacterium]
MGLERRALGTYGERRAAVWYERRGYVVLARNWRCRHGELDLVVRRGGLVAFCEVKTRSSTAFGSPAEAVTALKRARIRRLAVAWLAESRVGAADLRFDVACVSGGRIEVLEGAF